MSDDEKKRDRPSFTLQDKLAPWIAHNRETNTFTKLGPYEVKRTVFSSESFHILDPQLDSPNPLFLIHREAFQGVKKEIAKLIVNFPLEGQMSPKHAITLGPEARKSANIPEKAKYYVYSYPIDVQWRHYDETLMNALRKCNCLGSPELMFLIMGGYVYFDGNFKIVTANAVITNQTRKKEEELMKSGLQFGKPEKFPAKFLNQLTLYDRLKIVSWPVLNQLSNPPKFFAWLRPKEELVAPDRERRIFGRHGGFVFLFHSDLDERGEELTGKNCYFPVICKNKECCSEYSNYSRENKNPLSQIGLSDNLTPQNSAENEEQEKEESARAEQEKGESARAKWNKINMLAFNMNEDDDDYEESSGSEEKGWDNMKDAFVRKPSEWPANIRESDTLQHSHSNYKSKKLLMAINEVANIHGLTIEEEEEEEDEEEMMPIPTMMHGTTTAMVKQFEGFTQNVKKLDGRVLGYFLASLPVNVLAKIDLDQVILAPSEDVSPMRVNLRQLLMKNHDHAVRVKAIRELVERDRLWNKVELDNCILELLEKQFENHLKTGSDDEEGVENRLLFSELVRRFYYYVKPVAQAKAELEGRIKEKHWLKIQYRQTLRIIRARFIKIGKNNADYSEYCYLAKIVINFIDPPRKIPFYEDGENSEFKVNESVIIRPLGNEKPRLAVIHEKLPTGDYRIGDSADLGSCRPETVKKGRVQRLFMWTCFRCKNNDEDMWRDIYPPKQWVSCTKCGLVTQKTLSTNRYHLRNLIRDSCYGGIYLGYDAVEKRDCAIKKNLLTQVEARIRIGTNDHVAEDIYKEIKYHTAVSPKDSLITPGILRIYDQFKDDTHHYLILEWADKGELFEHVVQNFQQPTFLQNEPAIALWKVSMKQMFYEICLGVKKIHNEGIVHRDLSLENLLVIENKNYVEGKMPKIRPVICDFGLATEHQRGMFVETVGKVSYMSPECSYGRYHGKPNDIWCLGVILVMMMMGAPPYTKIGDRPFQYLVGGPEKMRRLFKLYKRSHLIPIDAYQVLLGIFVDQEHRMTIERVLETNYCRTAPFPAYHNIY